MTLATKAGELRSHASDLQTRLDEAVAMNEDGVTISDPETGTISYYLPEGVSDTAANVKKHNSDAQAQATKDAKDLQAFIDKGEEDDARYQELLAKLKGGQDNPVYASTFIDAVGPENLTQIPVDVEDVYVDSKTGGGIVSKTEWENTEHGDAIAQIFGHMLAAGSTTWDTEKSQAVADAVANSVKDDPKKDWGGSNVNAPRMGALNTMLGVSQEGDLDGIEETEDHGLGLTYGTDFLVRMGQNLENAPTSNQYFDHQEGPRVGDSSNPLSGIVHAMAANPEAAKQWLAPAATQPPTVRVDADSTVSRIRAMMDNSAIGDNQWTDDWAKLAENVSAQAANQTALGASSPMNGRDSAAVVSGVLNAMGESSSNAMGETSSEFTLSGTARNLVGDTLERYPMGVDISAQAGNPKKYTTSPDSNSLWAANLQEQPLFSDLALSNLVGQVGQDDRAIVELQASQTVYNHERVAAIVEHAEDDSGGEAALAEALQDQSSTSGFFMGAIGRTSEQIGAAADQRVKFYADSAANLVSAIPVAPGAGAAIDTAVSFAMSEARDGAKNSIVNSLATAETEAKNENQKNYAEGVTYNQALTTMTLLQSGIYSAEELASTRKGVAVDASSVIASDGEVLVGPDSQGEVSSLTPEQYDALVEVGGVLPSGDNAGLTDITDRVTTRYTEASRNAKPDNGADPAPWD